MSVTQEDLELFGEDLVGFTQRVAAPVVDQRVGHLERQLGHMQTELAQQRVQAALDADPTLGDRWRQINDSPAFLAWLDELDGFSNERRLDLLQRAYKLGNGPRCRAFFKAYLAE